MEQVLAQAGLTSATIVAVEAIGGVLSTKPPAVDEQQEWVIAQARVQDERGHVVFATQGWHHASGTAARVDAYCKVLNFAVERITHKLARAFQPTADCDIGIAELEQQHLCRRRARLAQAASMTGRRARYRALGLSANPERGGCNHYKTAVVSRE